MADSADVHIRVTGDQMLTSVEHEAICIAVEYFLMERAGDFKWPIGAHEALAPGLLKLQAAKRLAIAEAGDAHAT